VGFGSTVAFAANFDQSGRITDSLSVDATAAGVIGNSFNPLSGQCVLYAIVLTDGTSDRQVETGIMRCDGLTLGHGTCTGGHSFAERFNGVDYYCVQGNTFTNGTRYNPIISRNSGTEVSGAITGASIAQVGFAASDAIGAFAWGEATGGSACPATSTNGAFRDWQRIIGGGSWGSVANGPTKYNKGNMPGPACWEIGDLSGGNFNVS
jgi:hypothetical protein